MRSIRRIKSEGQLTSNDLSLSEGGDCLKISTWRPSNDLDSNDVETDEKVEFGIKNEGDTAELKLHETTLPVVTSTKDYVDEADEDIKLKKNAEEEAWRKAVNKAGKCKKIKTATRPNLANLQSKTTSNLECDKIFRPLLEDPRPKVPALSPVWTPRSDHENEPTLGKIAEPKEMNLEIFADQPAPANKTPRIPDTKQKTRFKPEWIDLTPVPSNEHQGPKTKVISGTISSTTLFDNTSCKEERFQRESVRCRKQEKVPEPLKKPIFRPSIKVNIDPIIDPDVLESIRAVYIRDQLGSINRTESMNKDNVEISGGPLPSGYGIDPATLTFQSEYLGPEDSLNGGNNSNNGEYFQQYVPNTDGNDCGSFYQGNSEVFSQPQYQHAANGNESGYMQPQQCYNFGFGHDVPALQARRRSKFMINQSPFGCQNFDKQNFGTNRNAQEAPCFVRYPDFSAYFDPYNI